jgi:benzodiazapine receptor
MVVTIPACVFLGSVSGRLSGSGMDNRWFDGLIKPGIMPPGWAFGVAWTILYILMGAALAMILNARGAKGRGLALTLFVAQFVLNLVWSPLFFGAHQITMALYLIFAIFALAAATCYSFSRIRPLAAALLLPYLAWLCFAALLNFQFDQLNPDGETFIPASAATEVIL